MHRINTFIILFFALFTLLTFGSWTFLQSKTFGRILSKSITQIASDQLDTEISFSKVVIKFFPPALGLEDVRVEYDRLGTKISAEAGEIGVEFDVKLFKGEKLHLQKIYLLQGSVDLDIADSEDSGKHPWDLITEEIKKLPVDIEEIQVDKSQVTIKSQAINVNSLSLNLGKAEISINGSIKHLYLENMPDSIDLVRIEGVLKKDEFNATNLALIQKRSQIVSKLKVMSWHKLDAMNIKGEFDTDVFIPDISEWINVPEINFQNGSLRTNGRFSWSKEAGTSVENEFEIIDLESNFLLAQKIKGQLSSSDLNVYLENLLVENGNEKAILADRVLVWDNTKSVTLPNGVTARLENFELSNAVRILGDSLKPLRGELSGTIRFTLKRKDLFFYPVNGFVVKNLKLVTDEKQPIIHAKQIELRDSEFLVIDNALIMKAKMKSTNTDVEIEGYVGKGEVDFDFVKGQLNLEDLGNIAGLELKGSGINSIKAKGKIDDVLLSMKGELNNFEILGYKIGNANHEMSLSLKDGTVDIPFFKAKKARYEYQGIGRVNYKDFDLDINLDIPQISFSELKDALAPLESGFSFLPEDFDASIQGNVSLTAKKSISTLKVEADVYGQKIVAYDETFKSSKFTFVSEKRVIHLRDFSIEKEKGKLFGDLKYYLNDSRLDYNLSLRGLPSSEISIYKSTPLKLDFVSLGEFKGSYSKLEQKHNGFLALISSRIEEESVGDSKIEWNFDRSDVFINLDLIGGWFKLRTETVEENKKLKLKTDLLANVEDLPLLLRGLFGENSQLNTASGKLLVNGEFDFYRSEEFKPTGYLWLKEISLNTNQVRIDQKFPKNQIEFINGLITKWKLDVDSPLLKFDSRGVGDFRSRYRLENSLDMDAIFFELLSKNIQRAQGRTLSKLGLKYDGNFEFSGDFKGEKIVVSTDLLPFAISDLNYHMTLINQELDVESFRFKPASGLISASGGILFDKRMPDINLSYQLERANIPIKNRSDITLSGNGLVFGGKPPYLINGSILVNKGLIANELSDFTSNASGISDTKYLPKEQDSTVAGLFNLDIGVKTENAVHINNSIMDLFLLADLQLLGEPLRPVAEGRVTSSGVQSKVFFKNSEYIISKSEFLFNSKKEITKPDFDIVASSNIANYKVSAKVFGTPDNFTFDLSSDPALTKQNILSLIAFGYTEDISNAITPQERQQLTNVGVGSFIFDQFKVTDIVKKQFGLQVNLGTMFVQAEESMLAGRGQEQSGSGTLARTRTATNIEVKKRLSEAMTLSVSSTVGGQIGQRQRMNLNYGVSKNIQFEGIYELRTNAEGQEDIIDNSIGGDVKFRMSFK